MNKSDLFTIIFTATVLVASIIVSYWNRLYWNKKIEPKENNSFFHNWMQSEMWPNNVIVVKDANNKIKTGKTYLIRIIDFTVLFTLLLAIIAVCFALTYLIVYKLLN